MHSAGDNPPTHLQRVAEPREVFIQGVTKDGKTFRPSDWAERLAGTMSCFRPDGGSGGRQSSAIRPSACRATSTASRACWSTPSCATMEPMAWDFVMHFARDNDLVVVDDPPVD